MMGDSDEGWLTVMGGGWRAATTCWWQWLAARVSGAGGSVAWSALALPPPAPYYMSGRALGWLAPTQNRLGEGFGFLLELLPSLSKPKGEFVFE
jgi:hypothetical protein